MAWWPHGMSSRPWWHHACRREGYRRYDQEGAASSRPFADDITDVHGYW